MIIFAWAAKLFLAALLLHAGVSKLRPQNRHYYQRVINAYQIVPSGSVFGVTVVLGLIESLAAIAILMPIYSQWGMYAAAALFLGYGLVFVQLLRQGRADIECGCAGPGTNIQISYWLLVRNIMLVCLCLLAANVVPAALTHLYLVLPLTWMIGVLYLSCEQLIANQQKIELLRNT